MTLGPAGRTLCDARTLLFVPGDRPERFARAAAAGADAVVVDLEDAVRTTNKDQARVEVRRWLEAGNHASVRINAHGTPWHDDDLRVLKGAEGLDGLLLPMADDAQVIARVHRSVGVCVLAIVETAKGVLRSTELAAAEGVVRLAFGALDLAADLETEDAGTFARVRTQLVLASRAASLNGPVDSVTTELGDGEAAGRDARAARAVGMKGKLCIHPRQLGPVAAAFAPIPSEVEWAARVLEVGGAGGVGVVDGLMIDEPVLARARRILGNTQAESQ